MKRVREKLKSTRGASILFAILVLMLCMFAGVAALVAAASNAGRFSHAEKDQQQYLSVGSAVELLQDELCTTELTFTRDFVKTYTWSYEPKVGGEEGELELVEETTYELKDTHPDAGDDSLLSTLVWEYCKDLFEAKYVPADWYTLPPDPKPTPPTLPSSSLKTKLTVAGTDSKLQKNLVSVTADLALDPDSHAITMELGAGDAPRAYATTVLLPVNVTQKTTTEVVTTGSDEDHGTTVTTTTLTVTMEWPSDGIIIIKNWEGQPSESD